MQSSTCTIKIPKARANGYCLSSNQHQHNYNTTKKSSYTMNPSNRISRLLHSPSCRQFASGQPIRSQTASRRAAHFFACDRNWTTQTQRNTTSLIRKSKAIPGQSIRLRRNFSATPAILHGHLDKAKPGEEYDRTMAYLERAMLTGVDAM